MTIKAMQSIAALLKSDLWPPHRMGDDRSGLTDNFFDFSTPTSISNELPEQTLPWIPQ